MPPRRSESRSAGIRRRPQDRDSKLNFNGTERRQLPHDAERLLDDHDLAPRTRIVQPRNLEHRRPTRRSASTAATKCRSHRRRITPETAQYDSPDGATTDVNVPQFATSAQHGRHRRRARDAARRADAEPLGGARPRSVHGRSARQRHDRNPVACPAGSRIGAVDDRERPAARLPHRPRLPRQAERQRRDHRPPFAIFLDAESVYGVSGAPRRPGGPEPRHRAPRSQLPHNPQLPVQRPAAEAQRRPPRAAGQRHLLRQIGHGNVVHAMDRRGRVEPVEPRSQPPAAPPPSRSRSRRARRRRTNKGGAFTSFTFALERNDGNQNLAKVQTVLPAGLVGLIPSVTRCAEPQAAAGNCPKSSQIGNATALAGVGSEPYPFSGPVYLTGPTGGQPVRALDPDRGGRRAVRPRPRHDRRRDRRRRAHRTCDRHGDAADDLSGVPLHLRGITVEVTKTNFLFNPTNCGALSTNSLLSSTQGATSGPATPFAVTGCTRPAVQAGVRRLAARRRRRAPTARA